jgi:hypothetical protein
MTAPAVTRELAIERLRQAGAHGPADLLAAWVNRDGTFGGWDGYVRRRFSNRIVAIIWPEEG